MSADHGVCATPEQALAFVREQGIVLVSAKGPALRLIDMIAGAPIMGNWWAHPDGRRIYAVMQTVTGSDQVLVCRMIKGKLTLVHRRLWPALVRLADRFTPAHLAQVREEHTASGRHVNHEVPFPDWLPLEVMDQAGAMSELQLQTAMIALRAALAG